MERHEVMKNLRGAQVAMVVGCLVVVPVQLMAETPQDHSQRMAWWREARFGMFIHYGIFSMPMNDPKAMDHYAEVTREEFIELASRFNPKRLDVNEWIRAAKTAGMKYVVLVTKSHDGWCLFDSKYTDFDVMGTPHKRDILKDLADACRRERLRVCWYYSIIDWHHPDYLPRRSGDKRPVTEANFDRYVTFMKNQLRELLSNYGPIGVLWFDGEWDSTWTRPRGEDLERYVRSLQPDIIINNRVARVRKDMLGMSAPNDPGDFCTPEQTFPTTKPTGVDWETCMTMNDHWQYITYDQNWKATSALIRQLVDCASKGGNYLLDVGPTPDGPLPPPAVERLAEIGRWMKINADSIHGTSAGLVDPTPDWGRCTMRSLPDGGTRLYLHVFDWPKDGTLRVPLLRSKPLKAFLLDDPRHQPIGLRQTATAIELTLPPQPPHTFVTTIALDIRGNLST